MSLQWRGSRVASGLSLARALFQHSLEMSSRAVGGPGEILAQADTDTAAVLTVDIDLVPSRSGAPHLALSARSAYSMPTMIS